jgi:hypothetical protein
LQSVTTLHVVCYKVLSYERTARKLGGTELELGMSVADLR